MTILPDSVVKRSCDWHCHLLPGIDDGPAELNEAVELAMALQGAGFSTICCTPHLLRGSFDATTDQVRRAVDRLQAELQRRRIPLRLVPGREYYLDEYLLTLLDDPLPLGDSRKLLVEIPPHGDPDHVGMTLFRIVQAGYTPLIAHPERCRLLDPLPSREQGPTGLLRIFRRFGPPVSPRSTEGGCRGEEAGLLGYLRAIGCGFQGNLGSFAGLYGEGVRRLALAHHAAGLYTHFGSDAHRPEGVGRWLAAGLAAAGLGSVPGR